jgi:chemotaxis family two-component system response regulator Rcp1
MTMALSILLVEDNPADVGLTIDAFRHTGAANHIEVCEDGESALARLRDETRPLPDLVLLDLNLPGLDGREVLQQIKRDPRLCSVPVCILTTSRAEADISRAYADHSNCYVVKPLDLHAFRNTIFEIERFWSHTVELPAAGATKLPIA